MNNRLTDKIRELRDRWLDEDATDAGDPEPGYDWFNMPMTARVLGPALAAAALVVTAAGCTPPPKQGIVTSTKFNGAHYDETIYCASTTTTYDRNGFATTTCTLYLPMHTWVPAAWSLKLKDGKHTGWRDVPQSVYDGDCGQLGVTYPDCETP
jgi:hypothetical protein